MHFCEELLFEEATFESENDIITIALQCQDIFYIFLRPRFANGERTVYLP
jgi:hypothetical protein